MVAQIGHISSDIKSRIDKLESFAMFEFEVVPSRSKEKRSATAEMVLKTPSQQPHHHHHHQHHHHHHSQQQQQITVGPSANGSQAEDNSAGEQQQQKPPAKKPKRVSIRDGPPDDGVRPCRDYFRALELERNAKTTKLAKLYDSIGPILIKLESLVLSAFTGKCPEMKYYYNYWEKQVFACFTRYKLSTLIIILGRGWASPSNNATFALVAALSILFRFTTRNLEKFMFDLQQERPLFEVDAVLAVPEILMKPTAAEVYGIAINSVTDFLQR